MGLQQPTHVTPRMAAARERWAKLARMVRMRDQGATLAEIGRAEGLSRERVRQVINQERKKREALDRGARA